MEINSQRLTKLFHLVGRIMDEEKTPDIRIVVSGGAALMAQGIISRSTFDVDVFARREFEGDLTTAFPLPAWFKEIVSRVAIVEGLRPDWINATTSLIGNGLEILPIKTLREIEETQYGERLKIGFLSREALILLKAYAISGRNEARDLTDFASLNPEPEQISGAIEWILSHSLIAPHDQFALREKLEKAAQKNFNE